MITTIDAWIITATVLIAFDKKGWGWFCVGMAIAQFLRTLKS